MVSLAVAVAVGEVGETAGTGAEGVRGAGAGEAAHDVAGADRALLRLPAGRARCLLEVHAVAVQDDEQLLAAAVAVRRRAELAGGDGEVPQRRPLGAGGGAEHAARRRAVAALDACARARPRGSTMVGRPRRRRVRHLQLADGRLLRERVRRVAGGDPAAAEPGDLGARQVAGLRDGALAEGEDVQAVGAGDERVGRPLDQVHEAVAGGDLVGGAALPAQARAGEDEERLFLAAVGVRRRRPLAGLDLDASQPEQPGAGRRAEVAPGALDRPYRDLPDRDVVPVDRRCAHDPAPPAVVAGHDASTRAGYDASRP